MLFAPYDKRCYTRAVSAVAELLVIIHTTSLTLSHTQCTVHADVDECSVNNGGCQYECENAVGSFVCRCPRGYQLDDDGRHCTCRYTIHQSHVAQSVANKNTRRLTQSDSHCYRQLQTSGDV